MQAGSYPMKTWPEYYQDYMYVIPFQTGRKTLLSPFWKQLQIGTIYRVKKSGKKQQFIRIMPPPEGAKGFLGYEMHPRLLKEHFLRIT